MCGLTGYVGNRLAKDIVLDSLERLEYRGYDSAGVVLLQSGGLVLEKSEGYLSVLREKMKKKMLCATCGIGHIRWATHGKPTSINAHPHTNEANTLALVHNGIIENYAQLKEELPGVRFRSQTDTEVVAHLISKLLPENATEAEVLQTLAAVCRKIKGAFAFALVLEHLPENIFIAKNKSPLIVGCGREENFVASDAPAVLEHTNRVIYLSDLEIGVVSADEVKIFDLDMNPSIKTPVEVDITLEEVEKGNYKTFMQKEIAQDSTALLHTVQYLEKSKLLSQIPVKKLENSSGIHIVACGTALHAGMVAKFLLERDVRLPVSLDFASEFIYKKPIVDDRSLCIFISQSGETAETLASLELAKSKGAYCIAITNVPGSRISQLADFVVPTLAGPEIAVPSTKAYVAQLAALYCMIKLFAKLKKRTVKFSIKELKDTATLLDGWSSEAALSRVVPALSKQQSLYFTGRGLDYYLAHEAALKLKEVSYIHCDAFSGGELKHGSLALISRKSYVLVLATQSELKDKMLNVINEIKSRGAKVVLFTQFEELRQYADCTVLLPKTKDILMPFVLIKPLQELALLCCERRGLNPDKPRNLAKSVTVE